MYASLPMMSVNVKTTGPSSTFTNAKQSCGCSERRAPQAGLLGLLLGLLPGALPGALLGALLGGLQGGLQGGLPGGLPEGPLGGLLGGGLLALRATDVLRMSNPLRLWIMIILIRRAWAVKAVRGWAVKLLGGVVNHSGGVKLLGGAVKLLEAVRVAL